MNATEWHIEFSRKGGQAGRGAAKRRSKEHYDRVLKLAREAKAKKRKQLK